MAPFIGAVLALTMFSEPVTTRLIIAAVLMGIGLWLHLVERHDHDHVHESLDHAHAHVHDAHPQHTHGQDAPPGEPPGHAHRPRPLVHSPPHSPDTSPEPRVGHRMIRTG